MKGVLYLAWRYLAYNRFKTAILVTAVTLIVYLPIGLRVLVTQSAEQLTARADATPLVLGLRGSPLELVLNSLYFGSDVPATMPYGEMEAAGEDGLVQVIPLHTRFRSQDTPIVGTNLDYFEVRGLRVAEGRRMAVLGEAVLGAAVARSQGLGPGDFVVSSPESVFDLAGVYPLRMKVVGVLDFSDGPDDQAIFVDVRTAWVIEGLGHGHQDLADPEAVSGVLSREGNQIVANASVMQYNEITPENIDSFHFHGELAAFPITAALIFPPDQRASTLFQGRYQSNEVSVQVVRPREVMDELLATVLTVQRFVVAGALIVGMATLASIILVFMLSLRLRQGERSTLLKLGGARRAVGALMGAEIVLVLGMGLVLALGLTVLTAAYGEVAVRVFVGL